MNKVFLSVGSNMGDREENLLFAFRMLAPILLDLNSSSVYETDPMYNTDQGKFLNAVFEGFTDLMPSQLLDAIHGIEEKAGRSRKRTTWKGPRPLDIDILLFGDVEMRTPELTIPHPGMTERKFVLVPLLELDPASAYKNFLPDSPKFGISYYKSSKMFDRMRPK